MKYLLDLVMQQLARAERLGAESSGNVAPIFALVLVPLMGLVGSAVDYSHANAIKASMQAAADATALRLAQNASGLAPGDISAAAAPIFKAQFKHLSQTGNLQVSAQLTDGTINVAASGSMKTDFLGTMGVSQLAIGARAAAKETPGSDQACVLSLDPLATGATTAQGNTVVNLIGCSLYDNSRNSSALTVGGYAKISALSVGVVGGISGNAAITTSHGVRTGLSPLRDPYAKLQVPSFSGCDEKNFSAKSAVTINPGVYCGGIQVNANANVTLNAGTYIIDGGSLTVNGNASIQGSGVTLIFTSSSGKDWATASINGGATVNLTPPPTGLTAGVVMFGDRDGPKDLSSKFVGGATQYLGGAVYFPSGAVTFEGGSGTGTNCTQLIANTIMFAGNSGLEINCSGYAIKPIFSTGLRLTM